MTCKAPLLALLVICAACHPSGGRPDGGAAAVAGAPDAGLDLEKVDASDPKQLLAMVDKMGGQLKGRPKTFEVAVALGNLYYENGRYLDAVDTYRQALELSAPAEGQWAALRAKGVRAAAELPLECRRSAAGYGLEQISKVAARLEATDAPRALRCLHEALGLAVSSRARRGNALYLIGNPDDALAEHRKVLDAEPDYPESLFFVGAILLEKSRASPDLREQGRKVWERLVKVAPDHPRGQIAKENLPKIDQLFAPIDAGPRVARGSMPPGHPPTGAAQPPSGGELPANHPPIDTGPTPEQVRNVAEAMKNMDSSPELEKSLDEAVARGEKFLDEGNYAEARGALIGAMAARPNDPKLAAALGGAMRGLGRMPMAERTLETALRMDPKSPRANYEMGLLLAHKGDKAGARRHLEAAKSADAAWAAKHKVDAELAKLQ